MEDRNSKKFLRDWMFSVLQDGLKRKTITLDDYDHLYIIGTAMIEKGLWRGDISEEWKRLGFGSSKLNDLYL